MKKKKPNLSRSLPKWSESQNCHFIPQHLLRGFHTGSEKNKKWLLHDKNKHGNNNIVEEIDDLKEVFSSPDLHLWRKEVEAEGHILRAGDAYNAEGQFAKNERETSRIIRKIWGHRHDPHLKLAPPDLVDLCKFLFVMNVRSPHYHAFMQSQSPDPADHSLAEISLGMLDDRHRWPEALPSFSSLVVESQSRMMELICGVLQGKRDDKWKKCSIIANVINDNHFSYITGSCPVCLLRTTPDGMLYAWVPVTKRMAFCVKGPHEIPVSPNIICASAKENTVRDVNRFIFDASPQILVESIKQLKAIRSSEKTRFWRDPPAKKLSFAISDSIIE